MRIGNNKGQTALILILLCAVALIFLAITLNWGRIAQTKTLLSISADQSASLLASDVASYGEMEKQTNLKDQNSLSALSGVLMDVIEIIVAIIALILAIPSGGSSLGAAFYFAAAAVVAAVVNTVLTITVIQPGMSAMWDKLQRNQPMQQQFYEQGLSTALQGAVTDQTNIADYLDSNANGRWGLTGLIANDTVARFALFYTDRLKMLNQPDNAQLALFYNQLQQFVGGETCAQNYKQNSSSQQEPLNPGCIDPKTNLDYCYPDASNPDPACQDSIPNGFQLDDECSNSNTTYNPYCDPCCQPMTEGSNAGRPSYCYSLTGYPNSCAPRASDPKPTAGSATAYCNSNPTDPCCGAPAQCSTNNPYGAGYPYIYDSAYQNYANNTSFLDKFGRDQQMMEPTPTSVPITSMSYQGQFPNGIYPFFWLAGGYSPEVDTIDVTNLKASQYHWCVAGGTTPVFTTPSSTSFPDLTQLGQTPYNLAYTCQGQDCCVNYLADNVVNGTPASDGTANGTVNGPMDKVQGIDMTAFGENKKNDGISDASATDVWQPGDNQMCSASWPYNGANSGFPDGTCEWTDSQADPSGSTSPAAAAASSISTMDDLDDVMHTLSDFDKFAQSTITGGLGPLNSNFTSWYPQAASWIAPQCSAGSTCDSDDPSTCTDNTCSPGSVGRLLTIYAPPSPTSTNTASTNTAQYPNVPGESTAPPVDKFNDWSTAITKWLGATYADDNAWCVPTQQTFSANSNDATEYNYININGGTGTWGDITHVIACLDYNANTAAANSVMPAGPAWNYQQCLAALQAEQNSNSCSALPAQCNPTVLGRSMAGPNPNNFVGDSSPSTNTNNGCQGQTVTGSCTPNAGAPTSSSDTTGTTTTQVTTTTCPTGTTTSCTITATTTSFKSAGCDATVQGSYANWVQKNETLFTDEAPKFALRAAFLTDIYNKAQAMPALFASAETALANFLKPCGTAAACADGGPAAQLVYASTQNNSPATSLPNSVIYGWQDRSLANGKVLPNGQPGAGGYTHIVKVTAYSAGRNTGWNGSQPIWPLLPWIHSWTTFLDQKYALQDRDGYVYVSIQRWDEDHSNSVLFPNGKVLWQTSLHNPAAGTGSMDNLWQECSNPATGFGWGLETLTANVGLASATAQDKVALAHAFMLNDNGSGQIDGKNDTGNYNNCIDNANALLKTGVESHACAEYVASGPQGPNSANSDACGSSSGDGDPDYCIKFVDCNAIDGGNPPVSKP